MKHTTATVTDEKAKLLPRITGFFFNRPKSTALIWLVVTVFGVLSYTTFLRREGFPSVSIPIVIVNGVYGVNDPAKVDKDIAGYVSQDALKLEGVKSIQTSSEANFFNATVIYEEGTDTNQAKQELEKAIKADSRLPKNTNLSYAAPYFGVTGPSKDKIDATVAFYDKTGNKTLRELTDSAQAAAKQLNSKKYTYIDTFFVQDPFQKVTNPATGSELTVQRTFDRYGEQSDKAQYYQSVTIAVAGNPDSDVIKLDTEIQNALATLKNDSAFAGISTTVTASYAPSIKDQISELQRVLLEGLLAVLIVGSIIIAVRASLITVLAMITVIASTLGIIFLLGYTLNVITLFALILGLSLIVDDTIIMVEAIDNARRRNKDRRLAVQEATRKIGRAMVAATLTATLSFVPLLFVGGVLGSFIRAIPVTIISALLISLVIALIFIPLFARNILLGPKQMGEGNVKEIMANFESKIARSIAKPMLWAQHHRRREFSVGIIAVLIGFVFIGIGGFVAQKVAFNIFPPSKDTNQIAISIGYPAGVNIEQAEEIAKDIENGTSMVLGDNFDKASYYGMANNQSATIYVDLLPYAEREATGPDLANKIDEQFKNFSAAKVDAFPVDIGPPSSTFRVTIDAADRPAAERLAADMAEYLKGQKLKRLSGEVATITDAQVANISSYKRTDGKQTLEVQATFDGTDTTTLTTLAQTAVTDEYDADRLKEFGLQPSDISFNLGQETENQDSFKALLIAFPLVLLAIYVLLVLQFRSLLQPLLIFMALPFSFFGISLGLYYTNNAFSFFAMLGFFALIGLSIKNTILLTDYANQARRAGMSPIEAAVGALGERFRPLVATSLTAVFSLIPLAITSPFWQGLAVVLIFGLLSSTLLVIFVFPYYYLGGEYLRMNISRGDFFTWLGLTALVVVPLSLLLKQPAITFGAAVLVTVSYVAFKIVRHRHARAGLTRRHHKVSGR